ncbi:MAG: hypothetical protein K0R92_2670 [Lachnospiraceae bacterium]|jgi:hypothetical protein|nr:hypothetical protein [Lachnospiraceae bacterium]MDF2845119.1 hypothetical protein [Herbinix sp.]
MKFNVFIKATLRQPIRSLSIVLIIGAITYGIISHVVEYMAVLDITNHLEKYYRPIGRLESNNGDVTLGKELVSEIPYVGFEDAQRCCIGVLKGLYNADIDGVMGHSIESYVNDVIFYGVLQEKKFIGNTDKNSNNFKHAKNNLNNNNKDYEEGEYHLVFKVNKVEAGYPDYLMEGNTIYVNYKPAIDDDLKAEFYTLQIGEQYLVRTNYSEDQNNSKNSPGQILSGKAGQWFLLDKLMDDKLYFYHIGEVTKVDYADEKLSGLKEELDIINENQRSMMVVGTKDMSLLPDFQESSRQYYMVDGRLLNREDDLNVKRVCVVSSFFAQKRGLSTGDKITLNLKNIDGRGFGYILHISPDMWNNWKLQESVEKEFEIVGIYDEVIPPGEIFMTSYSNKLFIPDSCMPEEFVQGMREVTYSVFYSFALKSAKDQENFLAENRNKFESMGISVSFVDNNADNFGISSNELKKSTQMSVFIYTTAFLTSLGLIVLIYLSQRRREFAIARAMGITKKSVIYQAGVAAVWIGLPGIIIGSTASWYMTLEKAKKMLQNFKVIGGVEYNPSLPVFWLLLIIIFLFSIFLLSIVIRAAYLVKWPVLGLLQDQAGKDNKKRYRKTVLQAELIDDKNRILNEINLPMHPGDKPIQASIKKIGWSGKNKIISSVRYISSHIVRSYGNSLLMIMITVGFITSFVWLNWTIQQNTEEIERLYNSTVIDGEILKNSLVDLSYGGGFIKPQVVENLEYSGLIKESYLEKTAFINALMGVYPDGTLNTDAVVPMAAMLSFNDWKQFVGGTGKEIVIEFMQGYDEKVFMTNESEVPEVIIQKTSMKKLREQLGDIVELRVGTNNYRCRIVGSFQGELPNGIIQNAVIISEYQIQKLVENDFCYLTAKFTFDPYKNKELLYKEKELKDMVLGSKNGAIELRLMIWDEELHQVIEPMERNLSLLKIIYPVAVVMFSLIGMVISFLMILLRVKEAVTMRVLGSSKGKVCILFAVEQSIICLLGVILTITLISNLHGRITATTQMNIAFYVIGCIIGVISGSAYITNKEPLKLLQVKE